MTVVFEDEKTSLPASVTSIPSGVTPGGTNDHRSGHSSNEIHVQLAAADDPDDEQTSLLATSRSPSTAPMPGGAQTPDDQAASEAHTGIAVGADSRSGQGNRGAHSVTAAAVQAGPDRAATRDAAPMVDAPFDPGLALAFAADILDDLEKVRIANENRLRQLTRSVEDSDGEVRGFGLDESAPEVARLAALVDGLAKLEHDAELELKRALRKHPLGPWVKNARGIGDKQGGRLIAAIGDPYWCDGYTKRDGTEVPEGPRTVSRLWAYCGLHVVGQTTIAAQSNRADDAQEGGPGPARLATQNTNAGVAAHRQRGQHANWSATAKMRAYLVAVSIVKAGGPYREVYDQARAKYDGALHEVECKRCGPSGKPAQPGSPVSAGHQHARALRAVSKAVLKDLWREAKRIHEESQ